MTRVLAKLPALTVALIVGATPGTSLAQGASSSDDLVGAWHGAMQFTSGAFAETKDLELMYAFAAGGTMTESSNYDAMPPVPPAYGVWRKVGARKFEAKYRFFQAKALSSVDELASSGGWAPNGYGVLTQTITLTADGNAFESRATLEMFDKDGKTVGGGEATAKGKRIGF